MNESEYDEIDESYSVDVESIKFMLQYRNKLTAWEISFLEGLLKQEIKTHNTKLGEIDMIILTKKQFDIIPTIGRR